MNQLEFEVILKKALTKIEQHMVETPGFRPLISIHKQIKYLIKLNNGEVDSSHLKDINVGLVVVREIENWDDELADLLHEISDGVRVLIKTDELSCS